MGPGLEVGVGEQRHPRPAAPAHACTDAGSYARTQACTLAHRYARVQVRMLGLRRRRTGCRPCALYLGRCRPAGSVPGVSCAGRFARREPSGAFGAGTYGWVRLPLLRAGTCGVTRASPAGTGLNYWLASWFASVKPHVRTAAVSAASLAARRPAWGPSREAAGAALVVVWAAGRVASGRRDHGPSRPHSAAQLRCDLPRGRVRTCSRERVLVRQTPGEGGPCPRHS